MNLNITYRHLEATPSIEEKIKSKVEHLEKYFHGNLDIHWVCSIEDNRHISEVNAHSGKINFHARAEDETLYKTFDEVISKLNTQIRRKNDQMNKH
ncbi:MAG: ribosome-associated translation inhibitor RaiA [Bdellovibrionota bacterium]|nr:ribosomal subunit interface protein [Pseudobdellovibrionaceae bacterium]|tara:strand:- start:71708 stop:71995 length:288 start_codon:yes stop_codon:yes gene_type:complete